MTGAAVVTLGAIAFLFGPVPSAWAANIPVTTTTDDANTDPTTCSLREAITAANTDAAYGGCLAGSGDDVIEIPAGTYFLTLTGVSEDNNLSGDLDIASTMVLSGAGASTTIVDGLISDRVLHVTAAGINLNLFGLTIQNGFSPIAGGGGGAYVTAGAATIENSAFLSNTVNMGGGGGLLATQDVTVTNSLFINNISSNILSSGNGGGLASSSGSVYVSGSLFSLNTVTGSGGGVYAFQNITITNSSFMSNTASGSFFPTPAGGFGGGAMAQTGSATISNSTFTANNAAGSGGGVYAFQGLTATASSFIRNQATLGLFPGGVAGGGTYVANGPTLIDGTFFISNTAFGAGGGLYASRAATITNASFVSNNNAAIIFTGGGGGIYALDSLNITSSEFISNTSQGSGGGVAAQQMATIGDSKFLSNTSQTFGGGLSAAQDLTLTTSTIAYNKAPLGSGGGLYLSVGTAMVSRTAFISNTANLGGALFAAADRTSLLNDLFADNAASAGGSAIHAEGLTKTLTVTHVTIAQPIIVTGTAVVISGTDTTALIRNTIIASHTAGIEASTGAVVTEDYNLFFGNTTDRVGVGVGGNSLVGDPVFVNPLLNDYHITGNSAAIGQGLDLGITPDFDGNPRPAGIAPTIGFVQDVDVAITGLAATNDSPKLATVPVQFTATVVAGTNVSYVWNFGDGQTGSGIAPTHSYATAGTYTAVVTATNSTNTVAATTPVTITTNGGDVAISGLTASNSSPQLANTAVQFTATVAAGTNVNYAWNFGDGQTGSGANPTHSYAIAGTYIAAVTATNATNSAVTTTPVTITANSGEIAIVGLSAVNNSPQRVNDAVQFTATVVAGTNVNYTWNFGDGQTGSGATPTHSYAVAGTYVAVVTATNSLGSQTTNTFVTITGAANAELAGKLTATFDSAVITYTLRVSNPHPTAVAVNVVLSGSLPAQSTLVSTNGISISTGGDYGAGYVQLTAGDLAPGQEVTLTWTISTPNRASDVITQGHATSDNAQITQSLLVRIYRVLLQIILNQSAVPQTP